ncbi:MAG: Uma2 family endonuclease [Symploca sp. SIO2E9]|nr:Uma2 family endonuclease [Symploca sp. SIO2E9]
MVKVSPGRKFTLEEFLALPEGDVNFEFVNGKAVSKVSPKFFHSSLQAALLVLIRPWCRGKGKICPEWAIRLKCQGEDWVPVPDLTYISYQRLPASWKRNQACPALPELVIEIISPGQTMKELEDKAKDYLEAGISRVWVVDPEAIVIRVFFLDGLSQVYTDTTPIVDRLLPSFELTIKQVLEEAELL